MTLKERVEYFIDDLGIDTKKFETNVGLSNGFVSHIGDSIREKSIGKILKIYPELNRNWLLTEVGEMRIAKSNSFNDHDSLYQKSPPQHTKQKPRSIPIYDTGIDDEVSDVVDIPQFRDCNFGKIIHDNAMSPAIQNGATIFCKLVTDKLLIIPGEIYFIKFDNYEKVRRLQKTEDKNVMLAVADNIETDQDGFRRYESFNLPIAKIKELYQVKGLLKQNLN